MDFKVGDAVQWNGSGTGVRVYRGVVREIKDGLIYIEDSEWHAISAVAPEKVEKHRRLTNPYYPATVLIHNAEEQARFEEAIRQAGLRGWSDFGETPEDDRLCEECGSEVSDHDDQGNCRY